MQSIINKAVEGGYEDGKYGFEQDFETPFIIATTEKSFWQALGKACGWEEMKNGGYAASYTMKKAIIFHEINLTEGWDKAVNYLLELTK